MHRVPPIIFKDILQKQKDSIVAMEHHNTEKLWQAYSSFVITAEFPHKNIKITLLQIIPSMVGFLQREILINMGIYCM
jgi:hypothetical protein